MSYKIETIHYIQKHFPMSRTEDIAKHLNLSTHSVRKVAKEHDITKSESYLQELKLDFVRS